MRVHETPRNAGYEVEHAACFAPLQDNVIDSEGCRVRVVRALEARLQNQPSVGGELAGQDVTDAVQHFFRRHVGEKAEAAAVDAQQGHVATSRQLPGVEHCAVSADSNDQVRGIGKIRFRQTSRRNLQRHIL